MVPHWIGPKGVPAAWQFPMIAGQRLPGVVHLDALELELRIQHNKASGNDGGAPTSKGLEPPEFSFDLTIETYEEHVAWHKLAPVVIPRKGSSIEGDASRLATASVAATFGNGPVLSLAGVAAAFGAASEIPRDFLTVYHPTLARYMITHCLVKKLRETPPRNGGPLRVRLVCLARMQHSGATHKPKVPANVDVPTIDVGGKGAKAPDYRTIVRPAYGVR